MIKATLNSRFRKIQRNIAFWYSYYLKLEKLSYPPLVLNLEPTNLCNLRCPFCPVALDNIDPKIERGLMSQAIFESILPEIAKIQPLIAINMGGESTLYPDLPERIRQLVNLGCYVFLDTNATKLTPDLSRKLIKSGLSEIVFCIDGEGDADSYEQMRVLADFESTISNVQEFLRLKKELGTSTPKTVIKNIRYWKEGKQLTFPTKLISYFSDAPPDFYRSSWADYWPGQHHENVEKTYEVEPFQEDRYSACTNLWKKMAISWDGNVYICCLDLDRTTLIGNVAAQGIMEIWNSQEMQNLRRKHRQGLQADIDLCSSCTMIQRAPVKSWSGMLSLRQERFTKFKDET